MYECFHCGQKAVIRDGDFDFSDYCLEGEGIIHVCHCTHCGAEIEYRITIPDKEGDEMKQDEVVRCKNCVHAVEATLHDDHKLVCDRGLRGLMVVEPDFYCADGEEGENGNGNRD